MLQAAPIAGFSDFQAKGNRQQAIGNLRRVLPPIHAHGRSGQVNTDDVDLKVLADKTGRSSTMRMSVTVLQGASIAGFSDSQAKGNRSQAIGNLRRVLPPIHAHGKSGQVNTDDVDLKVLADKTGWADIGANIRDSATGCVNTGVSAITEASDSSDSSKSLTLTKIHPEDGILRSSGSPGSSGCGS